MVKFNEKSGKNIQSVQRAVDILNCFDENKIELTLGQISTMLELNKSTVHGILNTLHNNGYIRQDSEGKYLLGASLLNKSRFEASSTRSLMLTSAKPYMMTIAKKYRITTNLFCIDIGRMPEFVHQEIPANAIYAISHVSDAALPHTTATGKLYLSSLSQAQLEAYLNANELTKVSSYTITEPSILKQELINIKEKSFSYEKEELAEGVSAISAPIYHSNGRLVGTISVTGVAYYLEQNRTNVATDLIKASRDISREAFGANFQK